ncbi:MAG: hypothetical protein PVS3B3_02280 [Ktedonobacteraceae bacterium]
MNMSDEERQALATEVLELGESLFEAALEVRGEEDTGSDEMMEIRAAKDDFFVSLRLLLKVEE